MRTVTAQTFCQCKRINNLLKVNPPPPHLFFLFLTQWSPLLRSTTMNNERRLKSQESSNVEKVHCEGGKETMQHLVKQKENIQTELSCGESPGVFQC